MAALQAALREKDAEILQLRDELEAAAHKQDDTVAQVSQSVSRWEPTQSRPRAGSSALLHFGETPPTFLTLPSNGKSAALPKRLHRQGGYFQKVPRRLFPVCRVVSEVFCSQDDARLRKGKQVKDGLYGHGVTPPPACRAAGLSLL